MDMQRIWTLLGKDLRLGSKNFLSIYVLIMPIVLTLLVSLVFGDLFAQTPRLGIYDAGQNSGFTQPLIEHPSINTAVYTSEEALKAAVERGTVEVGLSLPVGFEEQLASETEAVNLTIYRWGEMGARSGLHLESLISRAIIDGTSIDELPVTVNEHQIGEANTATWAQRLMPLLLIISTVIGGIFIPASSLIEEKQKRTITAITTTPASMLDVYLSKTLFGVLISVVMAVVFLALNRAFTGQIGLLLFVILLGGMLSSLSGIIMGSYSKDMDSFMGMIKAMGLLLYAPGLLQLFPKVPEWIGRIFPTYYIMNPLLEISQNGARFGDIALDIAILAGMIGVLIFILTRIIDQQRQQLALVN